MARWIRKPDSFSNGPACDRRRALLEASAIGLLVTAVVTAAIAGLWTYSRTSMEENYRAQLTALAQAAATLVDPDLHAQLRDPQQIDSPEYRRAVEPLRRMREGVPGIRFLYTLVRIDDEVHIILDAADPGDADGDGVEDRAPIGEPSWMRQDAKMRALGWGGAAPRAGATDSPYEDTWGAFMTGYAPFFDSHGKLAGAVGVDVDASEYLAHLRKGQRQMLLGLLPAAVLGLCLTAGIYLLRWRMLQASRAVAESAREAQRAARSDKLTGLANRMAFVERLQQVVTAVRAGYGAPFAVLFLDFDHFKHVNDTLGHEAGDDLLRQIAGRLRSNLGLGDAASDAGDTMVARFGGDEFVVLLGDVATERDARHAAEQLVRGLMAPYDLRGVEVRSAASIGVVASGRTPDDPESLIRMADLAMYAAKRSGRGCYVAFDDAMRAQMTRRLNLERSLMGAIGTDQVRLAYQPVIEIESGRRVAVEALLRWTHPTLGEIEPAEFLPLAEETGLIVPLGEWVVGAACRQLAQWQREDPAHAPRLVSVNVSRAELALGARLVDVVRNALTQSQLAPQRLQLEIPERELIRDRAGAAALVEQLRKLGVRLALDEFGNGTSSLAGLRGVPFDAVKMDRSFARGLTTSGDVMALVHATLALVENLGMASVAEGIEDPAQLAVLQSLGCRYAQGRLFSQPVPADEVLRDARAASTEQTAAGAATSAATTAITATATAA